MEKDDTLLFVTGARALAERKAAVLWAWEVLRARINVLPRNACILTGGCPRSPDEWAYEIGRTRKLTVVEYKLDGRRYVNSQIEERNSEWRMPDVVPPGSRPGEPGWPHIRNAALIEGALAALNAGWDVSVLAVLAPWSKTHGAVTTADRAERAGLTVIRETASATIGLAE